MEPNTRALSSVAFCLAHAYGLRLGFSVRVSKPESFGTWISVSRISGC